MLFTNLHYNHNVHDKNERGQKCSWKFVGRQEIPIQLVPLDVISSNDKDDNKWWHENHNPEEDDSVPSPCPPPPHWPRPTWVEFLL